MKARYICVTGVLLSVGNAATAQDEPPATTPAHEVCNALLEEAGTPPMAEPTEFPSECSSDDTMEFHKSGWDNGVFLANHGFNLFEGCEGFAEFREIFITGSLPKLPNPIPEPLSLLCRVTGEYDGAAKRFAELAACCGKETLCSDSDRTDAEIGKHVYCQITTASGGTVDPSDYSLPPTKQPNTCLTPDCEQAFSELTAQDETCRTYTIENFLDTYQRYVQAVCGESETHGCGTQ